MLTNLKIIRVNIRSHREHGFTHSDIHMVWPIREARQQLPVNVALSTACGEKSTQADSTTKRMTTRSTQSSTFTTAAATPMTKRKTSRSGRLPDNAWCHEDTCDYKHSGKSCYHAHAGPLPKSRRINASFVACINADKAANAARLNKPLVPLAPSTPPAGGVALKNGGMNMPHQNQLDGLHHFRLPTLVYMAMTPDLAALDSNGFSDSDDVQLRDDGDDRTLACTIELDVPMGISITPPAAQASTTKVTPGPLSYFEMRRFVESLDPSMPMSELKPIVARVNANTPQRVSPAVGGKAQRTRVDIVNELRRLTTMLDRSTQVTATTATDTHHHPSQANHRG